MQDFQQFLEAIGYLIALFAGIGGFAIVAVLVLNLNQHRPIVQRILRYL